MEVYLPQPLADNSHSKPTGITPKYHGLSKMYNMSILTALSGLPGSLKSM